MFKHDIYKQANVKKWPVEAIFSIMIKKQASHENMLNKSLSFSLNLYMSYLNQGAQVLVSLFHFHADCWLTCPLFFGMLSMIAYFRFTTFCFFFSQTRESGDPLSSKFSNNAVLGSLVVEFQNAAPLRLSSTFQPDVANLTASSPGVKNALDGFREFEVHIDMKKIILERISRLNNSDNQNTVTVNFRKCCWPTLLLLHIVNFYYLDLILKLSVRRQSV